MIRYIFVRHISSLYKTPKCKSEDAIFIPPSENKIFANILQRMPYKEGDSLEVVQVKLFYSDGSVITGWYVDYVDTIKIEPYQELFDGRFNQ
jgi:hypothetical protein